MLQFLPPSAVCDKIGLSRSSLDRMVRAGTFPQPIRLGEKRLVFNAEAVHDWMQERLDEQVRQATQASKAA